MREVLFCSYLFGMTMKYYFVFYNIFDTKRSGRKILASMLRRGSLSFIKQLHHDVLLERKAKVDVFFIMMICMVMELRY